MQASTVAIRFLSTDSFAYRLNRDDGIDDYIGGLTYDLKLDEPFASACAMMCHDMRLNYEDTNFVYQWGQAVADHHTPDNRLTTRRLTTGTVTLYCERKAT